MLLAAIFLNPKDFNKRTYTVEGKGVREFYEKPAKKRWGWGVGREKAALCGILFLVLTNYDLNMPFLFSLSLFFNSLL